jgi:hypothetical protein
MNADFIVVVVCYIQVTIVVWEDNMRLAMESVIKHKRPGQATFQ